MVKKGFPDDAKSEFSQLVSDRWKGERPSSQHPFTRGVSDLGGSIGEEGSWRNWLGQGELSWGSAPRTGSEP